MYLPARKYIEMAIVFFYIVKKQITMPFACNVMLIKQYDECAKKTVVFLSKYFNTKQWSKQNTNNT